MDQLAEEDTYGHSLLHMVRVANTINTNSPSVAVPTLTSAGHTPHQIMLVMTTSVDREQEVYGMGKDVA